MQVLVNGIEIPMSPGDGIDIEVRLSTGEEGKLGPCSFKCVDGPLQISGTKRQPVALLVEHDGLTIVGVSYGIDVLGSVGKRLLVAGGIADPAGYMPPTAYLAVGMAEQPAMPVPVFAGRGGYTVMRHSSPAARMRARAE